MDFLYFDYSFMEYYTQNIKAQSLDFKLGELIYSLFTNDGSVEKTSFDDFLCLDKKNGRYFVKKDSREFKGFIFDFANFKNSREYRKDMNLLLSKLFRFCIKRFNNFPLSTYEGHIQNSSKYIVNPYNFNIDEFFKFIIDVNPAPKRTDKRNFEVYLNIADGKGYLKTENPSLMNYQKAIKDLQTVYSEAKDEQVKIDKTDSSIRHRISSDLIVDEISNYIGYDRWLYYLSEPQKKFSLSSHFGPSRICGPAGSGKTLSLVIKAIFLAREAQMNSKSLKIGFICHSIAMKENIREKLEIDAFDFLDENGPVYIEVVTLLEWLVKYAIKDFKIEDCLEIDSDDMKVMQLLMVENAIKQFVDTELMTYSGFISSTFKDFILGKHKYQTAEIVRHEVSTYIKSIGINEFDQYKNNADDTKLIPWENEDDLKAIFRIFRLYEENIISINKYDIDDICKVAMGYLPESVWRRNRKFSGYDVVLVDEMHLFDFMELKTIPYLTKDHDKMQINCAIDTSQSSIDQNLTNKHIEKFFDGTVSDNNLNIIFRSTEGIINLTRYLFDSKIEIFSTSNPISSITGIENNDLTQPELIESINDDTLLDNLLVELKKEGNHRRNCLIVATSLSDVDLITKSLKVNNINYKVLKRRGDSIVQKKAIQENAIIISFIDYVGGLEFDKVFVFGIDKSKVPPSETSISKEFNEHLWYRKLYVAFTRTRKQLYLYSNISNGMHPFCDQACKEGLLTRAK